MKRNRQDVMTCMRMKTVLVALENHHYHDERDTYKG
jgi:hypothetical protein